MVKSERKSLIFVKDSLLLTITYNKCTTLPTLAYLQWNIHPRKDCIFCQEIFFSLVLPAVQFLALLSRYWTCAVYHPNTSTRTLHCCFLTSLVTTQHEKKESAVTTQKSSIIFNLSMIMFQLYLISGNFGAQKLHDSLLDEISFHLKKFKTSKFPWAKEVLLLVCICF